MSAEFMSDDDRALGTSHAIRSRMPQRGPPICRTRISPLTSSEATYLKFVISLRQGAFSRIPANAGLRVADWTTPDELINDQLGS